MTLAANQAYLFTNNNASGGYSGTRPGDQTYGTGFTDFASRRNFAGIRIVNGSARWSTASAAPSSPCREGTGHHHDDGPTATLSYERAGGTRTRTTTRPTSRGRRRASPQNFAGTGPGRPGAVGDGLRPGQRRRQRRPQREHARHVQRAGDGSTTPRSRSRAAARAIALTRHARERHASTCSTRPTTLPDGRDAARCASRATSTATTDTDDPPDTGSDFSATFTHDRRSRACGSTTSRARQHLSPYRNRIVAGVPGVVTATPLQRLLRPGSAARPRTTRTSEGIFVFTGRPTLPAAAAVGAAVTVSGRVTEFRAGLHAVVRAARLPGRNFGSSAYREPDDHRDRPRDGHAGGHRARSSRRSSASGGREHPRQGDRRRHAGPAAGRAAADHGQRRGRLAVRPVGGRDRLLRVARGHAHAGQQGGRGRADERLQRRRGRTRTPSWPCWPTAARTRAGVADRGPILVRSFDPFPPRDYRRGDFNPERIILNDPVARDNDLGAAARGAGRRPLRQAADRGRRLLVRQLQVPRAPRSRRSCAAS